MRSSTVHGHQKFEIRQEPIDVTSLHRPDERWRHVDPSGHVHQWEWPSGERLYRPDQKASLPLLRWVIDAQGIDEDGWEFTEGHHECVTCGARVEPGYCADQDRQFVGGLREFYIDDLAVTEEEFQRRWREVDGGAGLT